MRELSTALTIGLLSAMLMASPIYAADDQDDDTTSPEDLKPVAAHELKPVSANELKAAQLTPVQAHELAAAQLNKKKKPKPPAVIVAEPDPEHAPVVHDPHTKLEDFNPAIY
jgi:hypothetical protein